MVVLGEGVRRLERWRHKKGEAIFGDPFAKSKFFLTKRGGLWYCYGYNTRELHDDDQTADKAVFLLSAHTSPLPS